MPASHLDEASLFEVANDLLVQAQGRVVSEEA
jgi:hypothetical protein